MTKLQIFAAAALLSITPVFGQSMSSGQPVGSPILSPTAPADCQPGNPTQDPRCAHMTFPEPAPPPPPPSPSYAAPAGGGIHNSLVAGGSPASAAGLQNVVSYFQRGLIRIDTTQAFGFVVIPRAAVTEDDRAVQRRFCQTMLASLDYAAPEAASEGKFLMTYWPVSGVVERWQVEYAFKNRRCDDLIDWYDHSIARAIATKAGIAQLSGPLLVTWPSSDPANAQARAPLIVDFARADDEHAAKALRYWFRQLNSEPELWTNRIREGTIRAELADAINDTAGVILAVLHGKWDSVAALDE